MPSEGGDEQGYVVEARRGLPAWRDLSGGVAALWRRRGLVASLTLREVQVRYRQAYLGVLWALLQPLALVAVTTLVFHRFLAVPADGASYPLFAYTGLVPWTFFHGAVTYAVPSLVLNADLVRKIFFPREALPLAATGAVMLDLGAGLLLLVAWLAAAATPWTTHLLWVPVLLLLLLVAATAVALIGSAVNVYFRDVKHALPLLLQVLFFATPVVYPFRAVPAAWQRALALNPLTAVVTGLRDVTLRGRAPDGHLLLVGTLSATLLLVVAYVLFKGAERRFADVV